MEVIFSVSENILIAELLGELDHHAAEKIRTDIDEAVHSNDAKYLVFDFSKVRYMDSSGIGIVLGRYRKITAEGGKVMIAACPGTVKNIMNMAGIFSLMKYTENKEEAIRLIKETEEKNE